LAWASAGRPPERPLPPEVEDRRSRRRMLMRNERQCQCLPPAHTDPQLVHSRLMTASQRLGLRPVEAGGLFRRGAAFPWNPPAWTRASSNHVAARWKLPHLRPAMSASPQVSNAAAVPPARFRCSRFAPATTGAGGLEPAGGPAAQVRTFLVHGSWSRTAFHAFGRSAEPRRGAVRPAQPRDGPCPVPPESITPPRHRAQQPAWRG